MTQPTWLFLDFDNTLMGTEQHSVPSLITRFNELYGDKIAAPLTLEIFKQNFHGQGKQTLCDSLSAYYGITVEHALLNKDRDWNVMRHYRNLVGGVPMAEGMIEALTGLASQNYKFAFVSNNSVQRGMAAMRAASCGRGDALAHLLGANFFEAGDKQKPLPDVYLYAMEQVGATPDNSYAVEDSVTGTKAAIGAGLTVFGYTGFGDAPDEPGAKLREAGCRATFNNWAEFSALLNAHI